MTSERRHGRLAPKPDPKPRSNAWGFVAFVVLLFTFAAVNALALSLTP